MSFVVNTVENLNVNFCFVLNWTLLLLHMREIVTMCENSRDFILRRCGGRHSHRHLPKKTMFLL